MNLLKIKRKKCNVQFSELNISPATGNRTLVMGILNITPDSFYDGGRYFKLNDAVSRALEIVQEGADMIDIGAQTSKPGSKFISPKEELQRIIPLLDALKGKISIPISVDTFNHCVAEESLKRGVEIINDISGLKYDPLMAKTISKHNAGCILMHIKGTPQTMQHDLHYDDMLSNIVRYLRESIESARQAGIAEEKIVIDPGIGFGKSAEQNTMIIKNLHQFKKLGKKTMIGISRKSFLGKIIGNEKRDRLAGTISANLLSVLSGADIIRVHDVGAAKDMLAVLRALRVR